MSEFWQVRTLKKTAKILKKREKNGPEVKVLSCYSVLGPDTDSWFDL